MCTDAFHIRRVEGLQKILLAAQTYSIATTKDTEGCTDVREILIDNVRHISSWCILEIQATTEAIEDETKAEKMRAVVLEQLIDAVTRATDNLSGLVSDDIPRSDPSMN